MLAVCAFDMIAVQAISVHILHGHFHGIGAIAMCHYHPAKYYEINTKKHLGTDKIATTKQIKSQLCPYFIE